MKLIDKPIKFITEVRQELSKVAWSTRQEILASTFVVIASTFLMAVFIGSFDICLSKIVSVLVK